MSQKSDTTEVNSSMHGCSDGKSSELEDMLRALSLAFLPHDDPTEDQMNKGRVQKSGIFHFVGGQQGSFST